METIVENDRIAAGTETNEMSYKQIKGSSIFVSYLFPTGRFVS
jgi:hypothetical protein